MGDETELSLLRQVAADDVAAFVYADWLDDQGRPDEAAKVRGRVGFVRRVEVRPAWDRRHPEPDKNYGVAGVTLRFVLVGPLGAVHFTLHSGWMLPHVEEEETIGRLMIPGQLSEVALRVAIRALPADVDYHSPTPLHEGQDVTDPQCPYLGGRPCYADGSAAAADAAYDDLLRRGGEALWAHLRGVYDDRFGG